MQSQENNEGTGEDVEAQRGRIGRNRNSSESPSANHYFRTCINQRRAICDVSYAVYIQRKKMYVYRLPNYGFCRQPGERAARKWSIASLVALLPWSAHRFLASLNFTSGKFPFSCHINDAVSLILEKLVEASRLACDTLTLWSLSFTIIAWRSINPVGIFELSGAGKWMAIKRAKI